MEFLSIFSPEISNDSFSAILFTMLEFFIIFSPGIFAELLICSWLISVPLEFLISSSYTYDDSGSAILGELLEFLTIISPEISSDSCLVILSNILEFFSNYCLFGYLDNSTSR